MLTKEYLHHIKRLQLLCEANDQITLKLNWDMLQNRETDERNDFFLYDNNEFIAFLGLYGFGNKAEICGMVKPEYRRKGIFSKLLDEALEVCKTRKYKEVLLNVPAVSATAKSFLKAIPCEHSSTEYQMKWSFMELHEEKDVLIRTSLTDQDLKAEIQLDISCFDFMEDEAVDYNRRIRKDGNQQFFIIESDEKIVGKIRVAHEGKEAWIYGFLFFLNFREKELEE